jgi:predicted membrane protein
MRAKWHERMEEKTKYTASDFLDVTNVFGGSHRKMVTKNFRGGDSTTFMGGTEIDFSQADINGTAVLDVTQIMGATKIIVPSNWEVRSEISAIFAGFEDKRPQPVAINPDKVLILKGASVFGGIELRNF